MANIRSYRELNVYQAALDAATQIFGLSKRRYKAHFVSKLSDAEGEPEETRVWLDFALRCRYLNKDQFEEFGPSL